MLQLCDCHKSLSDLWDLSDMSRSFPSQGPCGSKRRNLELMGCGWVEKGIKMLPLTGQCLSTCGHGQMAGCLRMHTAKKIA